MILALTEFYLLTGKFSSHFNCWLDIFEIFNLKLLISWKKNTIIYKIILVLTVVLKAEGNSTSLQ